MIAYHDFVIGEGLEMNMAILTMRAKKYFIQLLETGHLFVPHVWPMSYIARYRRGGVKSVGYALVRPTCPKPSCRALDLNKY